MWLLGVEPGSPGRAEDRLLTAEPIFQPPLIVLKEIIVTTILILGPILNTLGNIFNLWMHTAFQDAMHTCTHTSPLSSALNSMTVTVA